MEAERKSVRLRKQAAEQRQHVIEIAEKQGVFMNLKLNLLVVVVTLSGCAGSPVHTSSMSTIQLRNVDDYTLCKAATPRELYNPTSGVIMEVSRRGLDCRSLYTYT